MLSNVRSKTPAPQPNARKLSLQLPAIASLSPTPHPLPIFTARQTPRPIKRPSAPSLQLSHFFRQPLVASKAPVPLRLRPCSCSTPKLSLRAQHLTFSTTSPLRVLSPSKTELERLFFLSPTQTLEQPELQLPHRTPSAVLPLAEEAARPRPTPSLGFAPFKPP